MSERGFFCEDELSAAELKAGLKNGTLKKWRPDSEGRRWFRAVKRSPLIIAEADDDDSDDEDDLEAESVHTSDQRIWGKVYDALVELRATGADIDNDFGNRVLEMTGKSMDDFNAEVQETIDMNAELGSDD